VQARSESARESILDLRLNLNLENLMQIQYLILLENLMQIQYLEHDSIHGDSMPVEQSRLAAFQV